MTKKTKTISAGVLVSDGTRLVLGHVTNTAKWDIPKGGVDVGESFLQAAVRELYEETGIEASDSDLIPLGKFEYTAKKDLVLYVLPVMQMPDPRSLVCISMFENTQGKLQPELDGFKLVSWDQLSKHCSEQLCNLLLSVQKQTQALVNANAG